MRIVIALIEIAHAFDKITPQLQEVAEDFMNNPG